MFLLQFKQKSDSLVSYLFGLQQQKPPKDFSHFVFGIWTHTDVNKGVTKLPNLLEKMNPKSTLKYSKASRYTAPSCTDLAGARFLNWVQKNLR